MDLYQYPSLTVSDRTDKKVDPLLHLRLLPEAHKLLYELKNLMTFRQLKQFKMTRLLRDVNGTILAVIIAQSVFGSDFIEIVPRYGIGGVGDISAPCKITLFNLPDIVPPMKWYEDGVHEGEIEDIDYIKTYYTVDKCEDCELFFTVCDNKQISSGELCSPFDYHNDDITGSTEDADNHCILTLSECQAEIIKFDSDDQGSYFIWKAYTEWNDFDPSTTDFSRNGLGYLVMQAVVKNLGTDQCWNEAAFIKVDCCEKTPGQRAPVMYWERDCVATSPCAVPTSLAYWTLNPYEDNSFWAEPKYGSCFPYTWSLSGPGTLATTGPYNQYAAYTAPAAGSCNDTVTITLQDRCGTQYIVVQNDCCDGADPLVLNYTTLQMACDGVQVLTAEGGCPPYEWSLAGGGGTLVDNLDGTATYTAPAANANCADSPTISLTDCCGSADSIQIAVNCDTTDADAYVEWSYTTSNYIFDCGMQMYRWNLFGEVYDCDGVWRRSCSYSPYIYTPQSTPPLTSGSTVCNYTIPGGALFCTPGTTGWHSCSGCAVGADCAACVTPIDDINCGPNPCIAGYTAIPGNGEVWDVRTATQKANGCCPINPVT